MGASGDVDVVLMSKGQFTQRRRDVKREEMAADIALSPDLLPELSPAWIQPCSFAIS